MTAAKAAHEQVRAHERGRSERHERDKGRQREDHDSYHGELRDEQSRSTIQTPTTPGIHSTA